jgi:hypothetical protein
MNDRLNMCSKYALWPVHLTWALAWCWPECQGECSIFAKGRVGYLVHECRIVLAVPVRKVYLHTEK